MELMGIADEGAVTIDGQIEVTQALGEAAQGHAADAAALQAELHAARLALQAEQARHDEERAGMHAAFDAERREIARSYAEAQGVPPCPSPVRIARRNRIEPAVACIFACAPFGFNRVFSSAK